MEIFFTVNIIGNHLLMKSYSNMNKQRNKETKKQRNKGRETGKLTQDKNKTSVERRKDKSKKGKEVFYVGWDEMVTGEMLC